MTLILSRKTRDRPRIIRPTLNRQADLGRNLQFAIIGAGQAPGLLIDAVYGLPLKANTFAGTPGQGVFGPTAGIRMDAAGEGYFATTPNYLRPADRVTIFLRAISLGAATANSPMFGTSYDTTDGSPFVGYALFESASAFEKGLINNSVANGTGVVLSQGKVTSLAMTYDRSTIRLYKNGIQNQTTAYTTAITYGATSQLTVGQYNTTGYSARNANFLFEVGYIYPNEALTASQIWALHNDPYGMWQETARPRRFYALGLVGDGSGSAVGVSAAGAVGTLAPAASKALTGVTAGGAAAGFAPTPAEPLSGATGAGVAASLALLAAESLTGVAAAGAVGSLTFSASASVSLAGVSAAGSAASVTTSTASTTNVAIPGVSATGAAAGSAGSGSGGIGGVGGGGEAAGFSLIVSDVATLAGVSAVGSVGVITGGAMVPISEPAPPERTYAITAESRVYLVPEETRTYAIAA